MDIKPYEEFLDFNIRQSKDSNDENVKLFAEYNNKLLIDSRLFFVDDEKRWLFLNTIPKNIKKELKMGFSNIFFCDRFKVNNFEICGLLCSFMEKESYSLMKSRTKDLINDQKNGDIYKNLYDSIKVSNKVGVSALIGILDKEGNRLNKGFMLDFSIDLTTGKYNHWFLSIKKDSKNINVLKKNITRYVVNSLLFLNEPRVVITVLNTNNKRRMKKGKIPIPSILITKLSKNFKEYIHISYNSHSKLGYSFEVMGHWRVLKNLRYKDNIGKEIWIAPYRKGEGLKVPQVWEIT